MPQCHFYPITHEEVTTALSGMSNKLALGPSGIGYKVVKWAFEAHPDFILNIFNATLHLRYHPWTTAKVVILPKLNKEDHSAAKAY